MDSIAVAVIDAVLVIAASALLAKPVSELPPDVGAVVGSSDLGTPSTVVVTVKVLVSVSLDTMILL